MHENKQTKRFYMHIDRRPSVFYNNRILNKKYIPDNPIEPRTKNEQSASRLYQSNYYNNSSTGIIIYYQTP